MKLPFVKVQGCGNDFVLVDADERAGHDGLARADWPAIARAASERRRGVGSDGLLVVLAPGRRGADARMAMFNPDGSESAMCGNGLRCFAKYLVDRGRAKARLSIETGCGVLPVRVEAHDAAGRASELSVAIGVPELARIDEPFEIANRTLRVTALSLGNPHCVVFVDDVEHCPVHSLGPAIERDPRFPDRTNVEFVQVSGRDELLQRTWERGAGETLACGSGATAAAVAARKVRGFGPVVRVRLRGGDLTVTWPGDGEPAWLRGPAVEVFEGSIEV